MSKVKWIVRRHSGNSNGGWRVIIETENKDLALDKFDHIAKKLRQGGVRLFCRCGEKEECTIWWWISLLPNQRGSLKKRQK